MWRILRFSSMLLYYLNTEAFIVTIYKAQSIPSNWFLANNRKSYSYKQQTKVGVHVKKTKGKSYLKLWAHIVDYLNHLIASPSMHTRPSLLKNLWKVCIKWKVLCLSSLSELHSHKYLSPFDINKHAQPKLLMTKLDSAVNWDREESCIYISI